MAFIEAFLKSLSELWMSHEEPSPASVVQVAADMDSAVTETEISLKEFAAEKTDYSNSQLTISDAGGRAGTAVDRAGDAAKMRSGAQDFIKWADNPVAAQADDRSRGSDLLVPMGPVVFLQNMLVAGQDVSRRLRKEVTSLTVNSSTQEAKVKRMEDLLAKSWKKQKDAEEKLAAYKRETEELRSALEERARLCRASGAALERMAAALAQS